MKILAIDTSADETSVAITEGSFRLIQSLPFPNAEPLKRQLGKGAL